MKKRKVFASLAMISCLIALSIATPLMISSASDYIAGKIRGTDQRR